MQIPERWVIAQGFLIRHNPSGNYIPQLLPNRRRGGSLLEPMDPKERQPRIFQSEKTAKNFLSQWCRGKHICTRHGDYDYLDEVTKIEPVPSRKREEMEIVPVVLVHKDL